jgi:L-galactose dehydrogenase
MQRLAVKNFAIARKGQVEMEYRVLGKTGQKLSVLGFGASPFGGGFGSVNEREAIHAVHTALEFGVNYIDVSPYYGMTQAETILGKALQTLPRDAYYLSTKVGRYGATSFDFSAERVAKSVDESLQRLHVDYVDFIICHDIEYGSLEQVMNETIPMLRRLQSAGKVGYIGISGLPLKIFRHVAEQTEIDFILSYCHYCLNDTSLLNLVPSLEAKGIGIINASPLSMGLLTKGGPPEWHPAPAIIQEKCAEAACYCRGKGVDISQLALQFSFAQSDFASTLVGISRTEEIVTNIQQLNHKLDQELLSEVQAILRPIYNLSWLSGRPENNDLDENGH